MSKSLCPICHVTGVIKQCIKGIVPWLNYNWKCNVLQLDLFWHPLVVILFSLRSSTQCVQCQWEAAFRANLLSCTIAGISPLIVCTRIRAVGLSTLTGHWEVKRTGGGENNKCIIAMSTHRRINRISLRIWTTNIWHCRCRAKQTAGIYISKVSEIPLGIYETDWNVGSVIHWEVGRLTNSL